MISTARCPSLCPWRTCEESRKPSAEVTRNNPLQRTRRERRAAEREPWAARKLMSKSRLSRRSTKTFSSTSMTRCGRLFSSRNAGDFSRCFRRYSETFSTSAARQSGAWRPSPSSTFLPASSQWKQQSRSAVCCAVPVTRHLPSSTGRSKIAGGTCAGPTVIALIISMWSSTEAQRGLNGCDSETRCEPILPSRRSTRSSSSSWPPSTFETERRIQMQSSSSWKLYHGHDVHAREDR